MAGSSPTPMTVEKLILNLKLLPMNMKIQVSNIEGTFYIMDLEILDNCLINFVLAKMPQDYNPR